MTKDKTYQELSSELDQLLEELQTAELEVDDAIAKYERGMAIIEQLETQLKTAENKVKKIKAQFDKA